MTTNNARPRGARPACVRVEPELSAFLDGELAAEEHARVSRHLDGCTDCSAAVARLGAVTGVLRRWDAQETRYAQSHAFRARVLRRLAVEPGKAVVADLAPVSVVPSSSRMHWSSALHWAAAAAVVAAASLGAARVWDYGAGEHGEDGDRHDDRLVSVGRAFEKRAFEKRAFAAGDPSVVAAGEGSALSGPATFDWETVVRSRDPGTLPEPPTDEPPYIDWENRGEHTIARSAAVDYEAFSAERRMLGVVEKLRGASVARVGATAGAPPVSPISSFLGSLRLTEGTFPTYKRVQVWPIETDAGESDGRISTGGEGPMTTGEALRSGALVAREGRLPGTVELRTKDLPRPVLILAGDVLSGGRQDRVAGEDVLLGPDSTLTISLVGSGRARRRSSYRRLTASLGMAPTDARAQLLAGSGQVEFDRIVAHTVATLNSPGWQGSLKNLFGNNELLKEADSYARQFESRLSRPGVIGFAVAAGSELLGVEVFGDVATYDVMRPRVLRSYLFEALTLSTEDIMGEAPPKADVVAVLAATRRGVVDRGRASGIGMIRDVADPDGGVVGFGLSRGADVIHVVAFPGRATGAVRAAARRSRGGGFGAGPGGGPDIDSSGPGGPERGSPPPGGAIGPEER